MSIDARERLAITLRLHELACDVTRAGIRVSFPDANDEEVERRLRERISLGHHGSRDVLGDLLSGEIGRKAT